MAVEFEDKTSEKARAVGKLFIMVFGALLIWVSYDLLFSKFLGFFGPFFAFITTVIFVFLFIWKGSGSENDSNIQVSPDGIFIIKENALISWKKIVKIELVRGSYRVLPTLCIVVGNKVNIVPLNLRNKNLENLKKIIESHGINVCVR